LQCSIIFRWRVTKLQEQKDKKKKSSGAASPAIILSLDPDFGSLWKHNQFESSSSSESSSHSSPNSTSQSFDLSSVQYPDSLISGMKPT
jgi:hypothetical protein